MATNLDRVVFVKDPSVLPEGVKHHEAIDSLAKANKLVLLLSHGNHYHLPQDWILPANVKLLEYDLDMPSIQAAVIRIRDILKQHGVDVYSRHLGGSSLPLVLSGAVITANLGIQLAFVNGEDEYLKTHKILETPPSTSDSTEWDIL
jgi:hypothetical protein